MTMDNRPVTEEPRGTDSELNYPPDRGIRPASRISSSEDTGAPPVIPVNTNIPEVGVTEMMLSKRSAVLIGRSIANSLFQDLPLICR